MSESTSEIMDELVELLPYKPCVENVRRAGDRVLYDDDGEPREIVFGPAGLDPDLADAVLGAQVKALQSECLRLRRALADARVALMNGTTSGQRYEAWKAIGAVLTAGVAGG